MSDDQATHAVAVLEHMTRSLVDNPDEVSVEVADLGDRLELNVSVADGDMGRVIGKRGRMANAIRVVTRAAAVRDGVEVDIEFVD
ncbi:MAG: KH domain-containing protein [Microthrixaceae bacterium]|nr:KH domain-containing protein [Microthrixaceae bacterium]MCB1010553.1 KH domain-containing protein [Microthrixaceae bacterium]MCO5320888.1 KH domain-containing protein [Microthrixaceae bacterium]